MRVIKECSEEGRKMAVRREGKDMNHCHYHVGGSWTEKDGLEGLYY